MQEKLAEIAEQIGNFGMIAAGLTVLAIWGKIFYNGFANNEWTDI